MTLVAAPAPTATRVFVSYSHDSDEHRAAVQQLVERLRVDGIDARFDGDPTETPPKGWPHWSDEQIIAADYVLVVCTPTYRRRFESREAAGEGRGVIWEAGRLLDELYDEQRRNYRIIPVLLSDVGINAVPERLRRTRRFAVGSQYHALLALLRDEARRKALRNGTERWVLPTEAEELLSDEIEELPDDPPPSRLLVARFGVVPFSERARRRELEALTTWCAGDGVRVRLFHGPGGSGKTRLFRYWCRRQREKSWLAGFVRSELSTEDIEALLEDPRPTLLVVDYAESKSLGTVLDAALACRERRVTPLRIALVARTAGDWWAALRERNAELEVMLEREDPLLVQPLTAEGDLRRELFVSAFERFGKERGVDAAVPDRALDDKRYERVLYLHAAALDEIEHLRRGAKGDAPATTEGVLDSLLGHEARFWFSRWLMATDEKDRVALQRDEDARRRFVIGTNRAVGALTMRGGVPTRDLAATLLEVVDAPRHPRDGKLEPHQTMHMLLRSMYPGREVGHGTALEREATHLAPLEPDLLGEALVARVLDDEPRAYLDAVFVEASASAWENGFTILGRVTEGANGKATEAVRWLLSRKLETRAVPAVRAALTVSRQKVFSELSKIVTQRVVQDGPPELASDIVTALPGHSESLAELQAWATERLLPDAHGGERAGLLNYLGHCLGILGRREDALRITQEAVDTYRGLAEQQPETFISHLAIALNNLGHRLRQAGRLEDSLASSQEATVLYRQLAKKKPDAHTYGLGVSLIGLGQAQNELGHWKQAIASTDEATELYRTLAKKQPDSFLPALGVSLLNLGEYQSRIGHNDLAMIHTSEGVGIYRTLAEERPDAFLPTLAMGLNSLGLRQAVSRRPEEALSSTQEAAGIYRQLASQQPEAYRANLAMALSNLGLRQAELDQPEQALTSTNEAVQLYRESAIAQPEVIAPLLTKCLNNHGDRQMTLGLLDDALTSKREAVELCRPLAEQRPDAFLPNLAFMLATLGDTHRAHGHERQAEDALAEAVLHYRTLTERLPMAFLPHLAHCLHNLSVVQSESGRQHEALASAQEAVAIRRSLAEQQPDNFLPDVAVSLGNLGDILGNLAQPQEALDAYTESAEFFDSVLENLPQAYWESAHTLADGIRLACMALEHPIPAPLVEFIDRASSTLNSEQNSENAPES